MNTTQHTLIPIDVINDEPVISTLTIAEHILEKTSPLTNQKKNKNIVELIQDNKSDFEDFGVLRFQTAKPPLSKKGGRPITTIELNEAQYFYLMTLQRNTQKVKEFKKNATKAFFMMKSRLSTNSNPNEALTQAIAEMVNLTKTMQEHTKQMSDRMDKIEKRFDDQQKTDLEPYHIPSVPRWLDSNLTPSEKLLCGTIANFTDHRGFCKLRNADFAQMHGISLDAIKNVISRMYGQGIIKNHGTHQNRKLKIEKTIRNK